MHPKLTATLCLWSAGLIVGLIPILCHLLLACAGPHSHEWAGAWSVDILFGAITTSGLSAVTLFTRLSAGEITGRHLRPHSVLLMALNLVAFLLSGVLYGEISAGLIAGVDLTAPVVFLVLATGGSLYFEILLALQAMSAKSSD